jgi:cytochrome c oxidase cbb3-type subunit 3
MKKALLIITTFITGTFSVAQTSVQPAAVPPAPSGNPDTFLLVAIWTVIAISILVLIVAIYALTVIRSVLLEDKTGEKSEARTAVEITPSESFWSKLSKSLTKATPVEAENTIMFEHSYDGIRELDNHLPPWWKWLFYITIGWAAVYLFAFHVLKLFPSSADEYTNQITRAQEELTVRKSLMTSAIDETNVVFTNEASVITSGKSIFEKLCVACHLADGGGLVGPNLTDNYWLHGGSIRDIYKTIKYGVPEKGMITWQTQLKPSEIRDVACYIQTLVGTKPAKPKEPQGTLYEPGKQSAGTTDPGNQPKTTQ